MAGQRQRELVLGDAAAVVGNADELDAAFLEMHLDRLAAGIEAVFEQFLENGGGSFDHFASGNLADQQVREAGDGRHARIIMRPADQPAPEAPSSRFKPCSKSSQSPFKVRPSAWNYSPSSSTSSFTSTST